MKQGVRADRACGGEWCPKQTKGEVLLREGNLVISGKETKGQKLVKMQKSQEQRVRNAPLVTMKPCDDGQLLLAPEEAPNHSD